MDVKFPFAVVVLLLLAALPQTPARAFQVEGPATITETTRTLKTYPYSEPDPVPILTRDERLYPYHAFQGYAIEGEPMDWKVVTLENDYIQVFVLPEVGGKVWGAVIKATGEEFIYRNEVMKFRNIALRGPWTSGGIEFNFGVIGHTPSTASPVDYTLIENEDGSVSCVVGTMDLPSRTHWRVEIRLAPDKAYFETNVLWYNPTPTWQPYYNWMTSAAFARDDLRMYIPGTRFLGHPGESHAWPVNEDGRYLPDYGENTFGGHKSFHVVGELDEHFGGYYKDDDYGFGHWARNEEMPGQKLWLWALSREGGVWDDLLTDTDGQYVEYQAGRLHVQYSAGAAINPIKQATFEPGSADRWNEIWFPVVEIGGLSDVSRSGVLHVEEEDGTVSVGVNALESVTDTIRVFAGGQALAAYPIALGPLDVFTTSIPSPTGPFEVTLEGMGLRYSTDRTDLALARPFETDPQALPSIPETDQQVAQARELMEARQFTPARILLEQVMRAAPWHRDALVTAADLDFRTAKYADGLVLAERARQLDAYDSEANFVAGNLFRKLGKITDAREAFGWAARSMAFRSVSYSQLADLALMRSDWTEAEHYAELALDYDRINLQALLTASIAARRAGQAERSGDILARMMEIDPLSHSARAERFLALPSESAAAELLKSMRSEFAEQTLLEVAIGYAERGQDADAAAILRAGDTRGAVAAAWSWHLDGRAGAPAALDAGAVAFAFPYRIETLPILAAAAEASDHWSWSYLHALNLWGLGQTSAATHVITALGDAPDLSSFYITRAHLVPAQAERDLLLAQRTSGAGRLSLIHLIRFYQGEGRWEDAARTSGPGRTEYPNDFNLDLLHAESLLHLDRAGEALQILETTHVLPSENASQSHNLFEWAHVMSGLDVLESDPGAATAHFRRSLAWPEHLGQGRPYEPDDRIPQYLLALSLARGGAGDADLATLRTGLEAMATGMSEGSGGPESLGTQLLRRALQLEIR
ncbi:MAG: tetratricopeptide (TPR) repeat protein [Rhodothermales bacterium]|jgi:tetratricopeptide (TPR) repeat protein